VRRFIAAFLRGGGRATTSANPAARKEPPESGDESPHSKKKPYRLVTDGALRFKIAGQF